MSKKFKDIRDRFWVKVNKGSQDECWSWLGFKIHNGYGTIGSGGKCGPKILVHRLSWEIAHNCSVPKGMLVLHFCDNRACVNPKHLWLGTQKDNIRDMVAKGRGFYGNTSRGERHGMAKLTNEQVKTIKESFTIGISATSLAKEYGMSIAMMCYIRSGRNWKSVF